MSTEIIDHSRNNPATNYELKPQNRKAKGFTLIELLVVITILSVISSIGYFGLQNAQDKSRDARRKSDLKATKTALTSYYQDHDAYPPPSTGGEIQYTSDQTTPWIPGLTPNYIKELPKEPKQTSFASSPLSSLRHLFQFTALATHCPAAGTNQLTGCLWDGTDFNTPDGLAPSGPALSAPVPDTATALDIDWGQGAPDNQEDNDTFSARWTGNFTFKAGGTYTFYAGADDGVRLKVDGQTVIDDWVLTSYRERSVTLSFSEAAHTIQLEFFENYGNARVSLRWVLISAPCANAASVGTNQLIGCLWDGTDFNVGDGDAPAGPTLSSPAPDTATTLDIDWGGGGPNNFVGTGTFSARLRGHFTFKAGTYTFYAGADDGIRLRIDTITKIDDWVLTSYRERRVDVTFDTEALHGIELDYFENHGQARVSLRWTYTAPLPGTIGGYKVIMPGNQKIAPAANQTVTLDGASPVTPNPYSFTNVTALAPHTVAVTTPAGWTAGYTLCYNRTNCHSPGEPGYNLISGASATVNIPSGGYADLWWHYTAPGGSPSPGPSPSPSPSTSPLPLPSPSPAPTPSPPPPSGSCVGKTNVYCYIVNTGRTYFILWAKLENAKDLEIYNQPAALCTVSPPSTDYNYCVEAQK